MSKAEAAPASLEPLSHLLAAAVARDLPSQEVVLVTVSGGAVSLDKWTGGLPVPVIKPMGAMPWTTTRLVSLIAPDVNGIRRGRVFVLNLDDPLHLPASFQSVFFDRVVYVTTVIPTTMRSELQALLQTSWGFASVPYFSAFVSTIIGKRSPSGLPWSLLPWADGFGVRPMADKADLSGTTPTGIANRLFRDACHLAFATPAIDAQWSAWQAAGRPADFLAHVTPGDEARAHRWSRAVTNRRVGIAVSGGGASAYRAGAVFRALAQQKIPVDVVSGLSGGAIVGGYYARGGLNGLTRVEAMGGVFQLALPVVLLSSWPLAALVDVDLGAPLVEENDVRFVAVTTELPHSGPPSSAVVVAGTLGSALRASGCLPPAFAPMKRHGSRFTDGGAAAIVPAQIVRDCGADVSLACNILPGAKESNPLDFIPVVGDLLHDWTPLGRLLDVWTWYCFMWSEASARFGELADVYLEFPPDQIPYVECLEWLFAAVIAQRATVGGVVGAAVGGLLTAWQKLQNP